MIVGLLEEARDRGFLGPGPVEAHIEHARGFVQALRGATPETCADLGSGGGVPALVLALEWPDSSWLLIERGARRAAWLAEAAARLHLAERVEVVRAPAEDAARTHRAGVDLVTARGFGPPAVTAECGAPLLRLGGHLVASAPPGGEPERWPAAPLETLGLRLDRVVEGPPAFVVLVQAARCPDAYPRRAGVPAKRPIW